MAVDIIRNYPHQCLQGNYTPKTAEGIVEGMFVYLDSNNLLVKAIGAANEYAMLSMSTQDKEQGNLLAVIKENGSFFTSYFKVGPSYTPGCRLQVSVAGGEEGILTIHAGAGAPVIGRYIKVETINGVSMLGFDLTRS